MEKSSMKSRVLSSNEQGIAHLGLILVVIVFVGVGSLVYWRFQGANKKDSVSEVKASKTQGDLYKQINSASSDAENTNVGSASDDQASAEEGL